VRVGGWLFKRRTWLPQPIILAIVIIPVTNMPVALMAAGALLVVLGELIRLWGVSHIGVISRTRSDRLGPLVSTGPFARVRNPLYVGNLLIWTGFAVSANLLWLVPVVVLLVGLEYHAIVRWEETLLEARLGEAYRDYMRRVPRWLPIGGSKRTRPTGEAEPPANPRFSLGDTLFSERGTLIAIVAGYALLFLKGSDLGARLR
jgi:protein-S-isoprenylcysteine O-methyltransferase Ste14